MLKIPAIFRINLSGDVSGFRPPGSGVTFKLLVDEISQSAGVYPAVTLRLSSFDDLSIPLPRAVVCEPPPGEV